MKQRWFLLYRRNETLDLKENKREIMVKNLYKERIMIVFPGGANVNDKIGLPEDDNKDSKE